jgi:hypothetical protein
MATAGGKRNQASYFVDLCLQVLCAASCIPQLSRQHERVFASRQKSLQSCYKTLSRNAFSKEEALPELMRIAEIREMILNMTAEPKSI